MIFKSPSGEMGGWGGQAQRSHRWLPYGDKAEVAAAQRPLIKGMLTHQQGQGLEKTPPLTLSTEPAAALTDVPRDPGENRWAQVSDSGSRTSRSFPHEAAPAPHFRPQCDSCPVPTLGPRGDHLGGTKRWAP